jgi:hypothetical protein
MQELNKLENKLGKLLSQVEDKPTKPSTVTHVFKSIHNESFKDFMKRKQMKQDRALNTKE